MKAMAEKAWQRSHYLPLSERTLYISGYLQAGIDQNLITPEEGSELLREFVTKPGEGVKK